MSSAQREFGILEHDIPVDVSSLNTRESELYMGALVHLRNERYMPGLSLLEQIPEDSDLYGKAQKLIEQTKARLEESAKQEIHNLIGKIEEVYKNRRFKLANELLDDALKKLGLLPGYDSLKWSVDLRIWKDRIQVGTDIWSKYSQAKTYLREASESNHTEKLSDAMQLFEEVINCPEHDEAIDYIRGEAVKARQGVFIGGLRGTCDLEMVRQNLLSLMRTSPTDTSLQQRYKLLTAMEFFENVMQQSEVIPQEMRDRDAKIVEELKKSSENIRREARAWFGASLVFAVIAMGIFLYGILLLFQAQDPLNYLTPLYSLIPGMLTRLFFKQYDSANQRMDEEIKVVRMQIIENDKWSVDAFEELKKQVSQQLQIVDKAYAAEGEIALAVEV